MKGWRSLTSASLLDAEEEIEAVSEAELLRESSDSDSEPSVVPNSSQTSDDSWMCHWRQLGCLCVCVCKRILRKCRYQYKFLIRSDVVS